MEVQERTPENEPRVPTLRSRSSGAAVEGYVPRSSFKKEIDNKSPPVNDTTYQRRVRFSEFSEPKADEHAIEKTDFSVKQQQITATDNNMQSTKGEEAPTLTPTPLPPQKAVFVFDVEGHTEADDAGIGEKFGRLRVVDAGVRGGGGGVGDQERCPGEGSPGGLGTCAAASADPRIDEILTLTLRQGTKKLFPQLAATLPPDVDLGDSGSECASSGAGESETEEEEEEDSSWMETSSEEDAGDGFVVGTGVDSYRSGRRPYKFSFFTQLHMHLEVWVTDSTLDLMQGRGSFEDRVLPEAVPEIHNALSRFIGIALHPVMEKLRIGVPRGEVERAVADTLRTLRLTGPLPAFTAVQWQSVVIVMLKALSMERLPSLRPTFETREGIQRLGQALGANAMTLEEFYAILELLLEEDVNTVVTDE